MRFKLDENMPHALAKLLSEKEHDVKTAADEQLSGSRDPAILEAAMLEDRVFWTFDIGFADIRTYPSGKHAGIIVVRLRDQRWSTLRPRAVELLETLDIKILKSSVAIVGESRIRYKRLKP